MPVRAGNPKMIPQRIIMNEERNELNPVTGYQCATCDEIKHDTPNVANHFNVKGEACQWMICDECKVAFEKDDITFEFLDNH